MMKRELPPPKPSASEMFGPFLPPGSMLRDGKLVPIPPKLNDPVECERNLRRINSKPIPLSLLEAEPWASRGGSAGFSWNGMPVGRARR